MKVRTLYRWLVPILLLLACLTVILFFAPKRVQIRQAATALPAPPEPSAPFLQQPVPPGWPLRRTLPGGTSLDHSPMVEFNSFVDRLQDLQAVASRPVVFPEGFAEFIQTEDAKENWDKGPVLFIMERSGMPQGQTVYNYLNYALGGLTLAWKYDPTRDAILTDFQWRRDDPRSARELADALAQSRPPTYRDLLRQSMSESRSQFFDPRRAHDAWLDTFDALLSKPENFSHVWKLRFIDDTRRYVAPTMVENILAKKMRDDHGRTHLIVINIQPVMINEQQGSFTYYLFDDTGAFEKGGLINGGQDFEGARAALDSDEMTLTIRSPENNVATNEASYLLTGDGLVLKTLTKARYPEVVGQVLYQVKR